VSDTASPAAGSGLIAACITDSDSEDALSPIDRVVLRAALRERLVGAGRALSAPCQEPWTANHRLRGGGVLVSVSARGREVSAFAKGVSSVPPIYQRLVAALISGAPVPAPEIPAARVATTTRQTKPINRSWRAGALPPRERPPWHIYLNVGLGAVPSLLDDASTASSVGYRYSVGHWGVDLSGQFLTAGDSDDDFEFDPNTSGTLTTRSLLRARVAYIASPKDNSSVYGLAGIGWGETEAEHFGTLFELHSGSGMEVCATIGYEFRRKKSVRYALELGVTLPTYELESDFGNESLEVGPLLTLTVGLGWSPSVYNSL
jgi:hypothetical protein